MKFFKIRTIPSSLLWALGYFIGLGILSVILGQDVSWDLRNYHFYNPYMLLEGRIKYDILPAQIQTFFNPLLDLPFFISIYYWKIPPIVIGFILGGIQGLNIWLVHQILYYSLVNVDNKYKNLVSAIAAFTGIWGAGFLSELGTSLGDNTTSLFILGGLLIIIYALSKNELKLNHILLTGLLLGLGTGLKLTVAIYSISLIVAINFIQNTWKQKIKNVLVLIGGMIGGFLLTAGYWMFLMWQNFSNPLFPFFNSIFKSPYIETSHNLQDTRFLPKNIWQTFFYPFYFAQEQSLVAELKFRENRFAIAYILIVLFFLVILYKSLILHQKQQTNRLINLQALNLLLPFYLAAYLIWQKGFSIYRYLIPIELLTPVLIVLIMAYLYPYKKQVFVISLVLFALIIATVKPLDWWRTSWSSNYFGINSEALQRYENSTIVVWGDEATAYIVPYFPQETRFVRIKGNAGLSEDTLMRKKAEEFVKNSHINSLYFLEYNLTRKTVEDSQDLAKYNLTINNTDCQTLPTYIEEYSICPLKKLK